MMKKMDKTFNATGKNYGSVKGDRTIEDIKVRRQDRWNFLFIAGMWFQDLFNYDFRRTEQCIIPYATQEGEISFCAYNTGVGWRNIIEKMHMTATLTKWYEEHGRHEIFAGGKKVAMNQVGHDLNVNMEHANAEANHTLDNLGIAKNSREEKIRARDEKMKEDAENAKMAKLYREHVLGEKPVEAAWFRSATSARRRTTPLHPSTAIPKSRRSRKANSSPATSIACSSRAFGARKPKTEDKKLPPLVLSKKGRPRVLTAFVLALGVDRTLKDRDKAPTTVQGSAGCANNDDGRMDIESNARSTFFM